MADLKRVYAAPTEEIALAELDGFDEKWSGKYPKIAKSWKDNWAKLSTHFKYPEAVRRLIYRKMLIHKKFTGIKILTYSDKSNGNIGFIASLPDN